MRNSILLVLFISLFDLVQAQSTWTQRLHCFGGFVYSHTDSLTGITDIDSSPDGFIYALGNYGLDNHQDLIKISSTGSNIAWTINVGSHGGLSGLFTNRVHSTADSGCVVAFNYYGNSSCFHIDGVIRKYSKQGVLQWEKGYSGNCWNPPYYDNELFDVIETSSGDYYGLVGDTLYRFDPMGNQISYKTIKGTRLEELSNGDLLIQTDPPQVMRIDTAGVVAWNIPGASLLASSPNHIFISLSTSIEKIDLNGNVIWTKFYPWSIADAEATTDGGLIACSGYIPGKILSQCPSCQMPGKLFRVDANGDTLWTRTFDFPHYGLGRLRILPDKRIATGGGYLRTEASYLNFARDYSSFVSVLDSNGMGALQTTTLTWPGDANNNSVAGFVDDALYTTIAFGDTGPARDSLSDCSFYWFTHGMMSNFASDWANSFTNGVNHKHADFDGNGILDSIDLVFYSFGDFLDFQPLSIVPWRRAGKGASLSSILPNFRLVPEQDTVSPGSNVIFQIIAGDASVPVDTVYGIAFSFDYGFGMLMNPPQVIFNNSDFGIPGTDLFPFQFGSGGFKVNAMACRLDHQDIYNLNDTIGTITITVSDTITSIQTLALQFDEFNALTYNQSVVQFNQVGGSVVIDPFFLGIKEGWRKEINIYPNPASERIFIRGLTSSGKIIVFDLLGEVIREFDISGSSAGFSVRDLPEGFYFARISTRDFITNISFVVSH